MVARIRWCIFCKLLFSSFRTNYSSKYKGPKHLSGCANLDVLLFHVQEEF